MKLVYKLFAIALVIAVLTAPFLLLSAPTQQGRWMCKDFTYYKDMLTFFNTELTENQRLNAKLVNTNNPWNSDHFCYNVIYPPE